MIGKRISSAPHCHVSAVSLIRFVDYDGNTYDRHKRRQYKQELFFPRLFHGSASCSDLFLSSPDAGGCRNVEETHLLFLRSCAKRKSVPHTSAGFLLHFLTRHIKLHFAVCICTCEENEGFQREYSLWRWVSNRGAQHSCWHTILLAKSSVLYLLRPLRWKGAVSRQTDTFRRQQNRRILWAESYKRQGICHEQNPPVRV